MGNIITESKSLRDKLTVHDAFDSMRESISNENYRHALEGATIIASPSILNAQLGTVSNKFNVHDSRYKLKIAQTVKDTLLDYSNNTLDNPELEIDKLLSLPVYHNYPGYGQKGLNLPFVVVQIYNKLDDEKKSLLCKRLGEITEKRLNSFYHNRGYKTDITKRPENITNYLIAEYELFTRITAETSNRSRNIF